MTKREPLISIIVPVYNGEQYLEECLDSICRQTYTNFEAIIVNDGSTDSTSSILSRFASSDHRFKIITQDNTGQAMARNAGLDVSKGEFITMIDADDIIDADFLRILYVLSLETGDDIVACDFTSDLGKLGLNRNGFMSLESNEFMKLTLSQKAFNHSVWAKLYKSRLWKNVRFDNIYYEDLEVFPHICLQCTSVTVTDARLYYYRINTSSFIHTFSAKRLDVLTAAERVLSTLKEYKCDKTIIEAACCRKLCALFNMFLVTYGMTDMADVNMRCWNEIKLMRGRHVLSRSSTMKLRLGIISSYLGKRFIVHLNRFLSISG